MSRPAPQAGTFDVQATDTGTKARAATLYTAHGQLQTPIFMPVGTQASIKAVLPEQMEQYVQPDIVLANTYHLYLRPGTEVLAGAGGLHAFMQWGKPILTDSGGYQVYSLADSRKVRDDGVLFQSHIDGSKHLFTPASVLETQRVIGSDIMMVLDECPPYPCERSYAENSLRLTHQWATAARKLYTSTRGRYGFEQLLFGIVQGATYTELREASCAHIAGLDLPGNAIGGLAVGEPSEELYDLAELCCDNLPQDKPRYLMGVGTPADILEAIARGVDMFDCVMPSRNARHGHLFSWDGIRSIKAARYKHDHSPIDPFSTLPTSLHYSKAYLNHLFRAGEATAHTLATLHNLHFYLDLVRTARQHILGGTFAGWYRGAIERVSYRHSNAAA